MSGPGEQLFSGLEQAGQLGAGEAVGDGAARTTRSRVVSANSPPAPAIPNADPVGAARTPGRQSSDTVIGATLGRAATTTPGPFLMNCDAH